MKRFWILILLVCTVVVVANQVGPRSEARFAWAVSEAAPTLSGVVKVNGNPVAGLRLFVAAETVNGPSERVAANRDGSYAFENLPAGEYRLTAFAPGLEPVSSSQRISWDGADSEKLDFELITGEYGSLTGSVIDVHSRTKIEGAQIRLVSSKQGSVRSTTSTREGEFTIGNIPSGLYTLLVAAEGWGVTPWPEPIHIEAGAQSGPIELAFLENLEAFEIKGRIHDGTRGLEGVEVLVLDGLKNGELHLATTDVRGWFELEVNPSSDLYMWVRKYDRGAMWFGSSDGLPAEDLMRLSELGLQLQMDEQTFGPWGISGRVHRSEFPVSGGWVEAVDADGRVCDIAPIWPDGRYQLGHMISGAYVLNLTVPGLMQKATRTVKVNSESVNDADFDLGLMTAK